MKRACSNQETFDLVKYDYSVPYGALEFTKIFQTL